MSAPRLGSGKRFSALEGKLAAEPGVRNPGAVAASIGRKKFGAAKMSKMAATGERRANAKPYAVAAAEKIKEGY